MADQFMGEIRLFAHGAAPKDWLPCDGRLLTLSTETRPLFAILGNRYGGDGFKNFGLPNLGGRLPGGAGAGPGLTQRNLADATGRETVMANIEHYPAHTHALCCGSGNSKDSEVTGGKILTRATVGSGSRPTPLNAYATDTEHIVPMGEKTFSVYGTSYLDRHNNMQPYLCLQFCIAIQGTYPPRPGEQAEG